MEQNSNPLKFTKAQVYLDFQRLEGDVIAKNERGKELENIVSCN